MKKILIILLMFSSIKCAFSQTDSRTYSKWHLSPGAGINLPLTKLFSGEITDNLIEFDDHSYYLKYISGSYFFSDKWGLEFAFQLNVAKSILGRGDRFNAQILDQYGDDYFVTYGFGTPYYGDNIITSSFSRGGLGLVYRIEKPKYIILPKIFIGTTAFDTDWGNAYLKEKGTHTVLELSYKSENGSGDNLTIAPGLLFGYRLSKRFIANFDLLYSYYKTDFQFVKELRNTFTEEVWTETIDYNKGIHTLSMGVGLIIELGLVRD